MMTGAFSWNVDKLFSELKLVTDNLFIWGGFVGENERDWKGERWTRWMQGGGVKGSWFLYSLSPGVSPGAGLWGTARLPPLLWPSDADQDTKARTEWYDITAHVTALLCLTYTLTPPNMVTVQISGRTIWFILTYLVICSIQASVAMAILN